MLTPAQNLSHVVETSSVVVRPEEPMSADRLLRRLEVLRQRVAVRWCGSAGSFAGYDALEMPGDVALTVGTVRVEARMIDAGPRSHTVEFLATVSSPDADDAADARDANVSPRMLVVGHGRTLHAACAPEAGLI